MSNRTSLLLPGSLLPAQYTWAPGWMDRLPVWGRHGAEWGEWAASLDGRFSLASEKLPTWQSWVQRSHTSQVKTPRCD
jgi:hypothetical protein